MKKMRKLLIVAGLLMALGLVIPSAKANVNTDDGLKVCSDAPAIESFGFL